jgi:hypothetical protein
MNFGGMLVRLLACVALVFGTWNPTGYSVLAWLHGPAAAAEKAAAGAALLAVHVLFVRVAWLSLGVAGTAATAAVLFTAVLSLSELDLVDLGRAETRSYLWLTGMALLLACGVVWSLFKRRAVGQSNYLNPPP